MKSKYMKVLDMVKAICKYNQENSLNNAVEERKEFFQSEEYLDIMLNRLLDCSSIKVKEDEIFLDINYKKEMSIEDLNTNIKVGYWLCSYIISADYYVVTWFLTLEEALKGYLNLMKDVFCGTKVIFFVNNTSITCIEVDGKYEI